MIKQTNIILMVFVLLLTVSCAPTMREISKETIENAEVAELLEKARQEGYNEAMTVANAQVQEKVMSFLRKYKNEMLYLEAVKAGVLQPGQVGMFYVPGKTSEDGFSFSAPTFAWQVIQQPQFLADEATNWWKKDEANFCYFFLQAYKSEADAAKAVGKIQKPDSVLLSAVPYGDQSGKFAVIGKTVAAACEDSMNYFENNGFKPVKVR